jgi:TonB family protein
VTRPLQFRAVLTLFVAGLFLATSSVQAQDGPPPRGVERMVYDVAPRLLNTQEIVEALDEAYPADLREQQISGSVVLWLFVDDSGAVAEALVHRRSAYRAFDAAALAIAEAMQFRPASMDDEPVGVWILQRLDFNLR